MDVSKLEESLAGQPAYRIEQAKEAIYKSLIFNWDEVVALPKQLRQQLSQACPLVIDSKIIISKTGESQKASVVLADGSKIEAVLTRHHDNRNTVRVSSQLGCPIGCLFCEIGKGGFKRDLLADEIIEQVLLFARILKKDGQRVTNVVFMGMGEPLLNYDNVIRAVKLLNDEKRLGIGSRHISIATVGITEGIEKLIDEPLQVNLAISLNAPNDQLRQKIMPATLKYPIDSLFKSVLRYVKNTNRRVMFEYLLIDGCNDSDECAEELARLIKSRLSLKLAFVNLIRDGNYDSAKTERIDAFRRILEAANIEITERFVL